MEEYDSDVAILRLTDGQTASAVVFGLAEAEMLEELEREPYQEALWKPLFPTKRGWAAFERLRSQQARLPEALESGDFDAFFAEEAIRTIAEALKFDAETARGFAEESDAEAVWRWPEQAKAGKRDLWMPEEMCIRDRSNAVLMAVERAIADAENGGFQPVPQHLRDTHYRGAEKLGSGEGYKVTVSSGATLTICDCQSGGAITGTESYINLNVISVEGGTLDVYKRQTVY